MPWKECHVEDERLRFIARRLDGESMTALCAEFGISRKTGYKIYDRYQDVGLQGLTDRSRRPYRQANQLPMAIEKTIVKLKREYPSWGAPKIREKLRRQHDDVQTPAISTVHAVLDRHGLVKHGRKRRYKAKGTALSLPRQPNDLWCADYKGEFTLADRTFPPATNGFANRNAELLPRWLDRRRTERLGWRTLVLLATLPGTRRRAKTTHVIAYGHSYNHQPAKRRGLL